MRRSVPDADLHTAGLFFRLLDLVVAWRLAKRLEVIKFEEQRPRTTMRSDVISDWRVRVWALSAADRTAHATGVVIPFVCLLLKIAPFRRVIPLSPRLRTGRGRRHHTPKTTKGDPIRTAFQYQVAIRAHAFDARFRPQLQAGFRSKRCLD